MEMEKRWDNRAQLSQWSSFSVICKLAEEIEKATGKEEQFKVVKGRVIEKNVPSFQPISFHCSGKVKLYSST